MTTTHPTRVNPDLYNLTDGFTIQQVDDFLGSLHHQQVGALEILSNDPTIQTTLRELGKSLSDAADLIDLLYTQLKEATKDW